MIAMLMAAALAGGAQAAATPAPSAEAEALGLEVAHSGALASTLPMLEKKEVADIVAAHPELTAGDQLKLTAVADRVYQEQAERLTMAIGHEYATALSVEDLRAIAAFTKSDAGRHYRDVVPHMVAVVSKLLGGFDFKGETLKAFCAQTGKACPPAQ